MKKVNIYVYTTVKGPRRHSGTGIYVLEMETKKGPATKSDIEKLVDVTEHQADLRILAAAVKRIFEHCHLTIYTDSVYLASGLQQWLDVWQKNNWKNAKGEDVSNVDEWKELAILLKEHEYKLRIGESHSYHEWMQRETEKVDRTCMP